MKIKGYYSGALAAKLNAAIKTALTKFQQDNTLPIGSVDLETVKHWELQSNFCVIQAKGCFVYRSSLFYLSAYNQLSSHLQINKL